MLNSPVIIISENCMDEKYPSLNVNRKRGAEFKDRIKENCHEIKDKLEEYTSATSSAIQE